MNAIGKPERASQNPVTAVFKNELGHRHLGDWTDRANGNVEDGLLGTKLRTRRYSATQISSAIYKLRTEASNPARSLYQNNQAVYSLLRSGVAGAAGGVESIAGAA